MNDDGASTGDEGPVPLDVSDKTDDTVDIYHKLYGPTHANATALALTARRPTNRDLTAARPPLAAPPMKLAPPFLRPASALAAFTTTLPLSRVCPPMAITLAASAGFFSFVEAVFYPLPAPSALRSNL